MSSFWKIASTYTLQSLFHSIYISVVDGYCWKLLGIRVGGGGGGDDLVEKCD